MGAGAEFQRYLRNVEEALRARDLETAMRLSEEAVSRGFEHVNLLTLAAHRQLALGRTEQALTLALRALDLSPRNVDVLNAVGLARARLGRHREAIDAFNAALRQSPAAYMVRFNKASSLEELQDLPRARIEFERVLDSQPAHAEALARLASLAAQRGDMKAARVYAGRALRIDPHQAAAPLTLATADIAEKQFQSALARARPLAGETNPSATNRSIAQGLMGDAFDALDMKCEAFAAYTASQSTLRDHWRSFYAAPGRESAAALVARLNRYFRTASDSQWRAGAKDSAPGPVKTHAFLVGFPRSGTTMLEQILASHPDIETLEERCCLATAQKSFTTPQDGLERLADLRGDDLAFHREAYWKLVAQEGIALRRPVFIDKMPLHSVFLCLVAKLFPGARIVFALRDPRDVVFSCFRRRFVMTAEMYELTSLETAADYYDAVMRLRELYRKKLGLAILDVKYEDVMDNFDTQTRRLCDFLVMPWSESMERFVDVARTRAINTPSGPQLAQGWSRQGMGQWRRYRSQLAPVLGRLAPWVARFGYEAERGDP